jgi:hypothetical protein
LIIAALKGFFPAIAIRLGPLGFSHNCGSFWLEVEGGCGVDGIAWLTVVGRAAQGNEFVTTGCDMDRVLQKIEEFTTMDSRH